MTEKAKERGKELCEAGAVTLLGGGRLRGWSFFEVGAGEGMRVVEIEPPKPRGYTPAVRAGYAACVPAGDLTDGALGGQMNDHPAPCYRGSIRGGELCEHIYAALQWREEGKRERKEQRERELAEAEAYYYAGSELGRAALQLFGR